MFSCTCMEKKTTRCTSHDTLTHGMEKKTTRCTPHDTLTHGMDDPNDPSTTCNVGNDEMIRKGRTTRNARSAFTSALELEASPREMVTTPMIAMVPSIQFQPELRYEGGPHHHRPFAMMRSTISTKKKTTNHASDLAKRSLCMVESLPAMGFSSARPTQVARIMPMTHVSKAWLSTILRQRTRTELLKEKIPKDFEVKMSFRLPLFGSGANMESWIDSTTVACVVTKKPKNKRRKKRKRRRISTTLCLLY